MKHTGDTTGQLVLVWTDSNPLSKMKEVTEHVPGFPPRVYKAVGYLMLLLLGDGTWRLDSSSDMLTLNIYAGERTTQHG